MNCDMASQKIAAVTGGSTGTGLSIVRALCKQFHGDVYLTARDEESGKLAVQKLESEGLHPKFLHLDITDRRSIDAFKLFLIANYGGIDIFVHSDGITHDSSSREQPKVTVFVNYTCSVYLCDTILPIMRPYGRICIVASQMGTDALTECSSKNQQLFRLPDITVEQINNKMEEFVQAAESNSYETMGFSDSVFGMSKLGVIAYTRILGRRASELRQPNVLANCCCPRYVLVDMLLDEWHLTPDDESITPMFLVKIPKDESKPNGEFLFDRKVVKWY